MGSLNKFNLKKLMLEYNVSYFFETGTWKGDGLAYAARFPFKKLISSEVIASVATRAQQRFHEDPRISVANDLSTTVLTRFLPELKGNCIFWLDAHFPGAEEGVKAYNDEEEEFVKLPLQKELEIIAARKGTYQDVILIDDLRIYEEGPFTGGNLPKEVLPPKVRNIHFAENLFRDSHMLRKSYQDEGYILLLPKQGKKLSFLQNAYHNLRNKLTRKIV